MVRAIALLADSTLPPDDDPYYSIATKDSFSYTQSLITFAIANNNRAIVIASIICFPQKPKNLTLLQEKKNARSPFLN